MSKGKWTSHKLLALQFQHEIALHSFRWCLFFVKLGFGSGYDRKQVSCKKLHGTENEGDGAQTGFKFGETV